MERNGLSHRDAGLLGVEATRKRIEALKQSNIDSYNKNPRKCLTCGAPIDYEHRINKFCSRSCSAKYNNKERMSDVQSRYLSSLQHGGDGTKYMCRVCGKLLSTLESKYCSPECEAVMLARKGNATKTPRTEKQRHCLWCGDILVTKGATKYCSLDCQGKHKVAQVRDEILRTGQFPASNEGETNRRVVRSFLEAEYGHACMMCGRTEWNGQPIMLIVDHIDGNSKNHSINNFRLICPNCDSTTDTYKYKHGRRSTRDWRQKYIKHVGDAQ